jgi:hypothetical protein
MWKKLSDWLRKVSSGWVALVALVVFALFTALVLPRQAASADTTAAEVGTPDLSFYYSADDLYRMAEAYGEEGRRAYIRARFTFDLIWPMVYTFFLVTAISWLYNRGFREGGPWQRANLAPMLGMLFDYLENITTSLVMLRYPTPTPLVAWLAPAFTSLKWVFVVGSFLLLFVGIVAVLWGWVRGRAQQE